MDERWIWAAVAVIGGLIVGAVTGVLIRRTLDRETRRPALREIAGPLSMFAFWLFVATGILVAIGVSSPDRLESIPGDLLAWLPKFAIAGLLLIGGYALGLTLATTVGRAISRVSGHRNRSFERTVRFSVLVGAGILALNQLGVDTTIVNILIGALVSSAALALAGLSIVGGRKTAEHVAAGRALTHVVTVGDTVQIGATEGVVAELLPVHAVLTTAEGRLVLPYASFADDQILIRTSASEAPAE